MAINLVEMNDQVTFAYQLQQDTGPAELIGTCHVAPDGADQPLAAWAEDATLIGKAAGLNRNPAP